MLGNKSHTSLAYPILSKIMAALLTFFLFSTYSMKPFLSTTKRNNNNNNNNKPWAPTREDELLLHDVDVLAGPPARCLQHDLLWVVAAHTAHPEPAAMGGGSHKSGVRGQETPGTTRGAGSPWWPRLALGEVDVSVQL